MVRALSNLLRMTPEPTSAEVLGKTVKRSQERLAESRPSEMRESTQMLELGALEAVKPATSPPIPSDATAIPLTQKKS